MMIKRDSGIMRNKKGWLRIVEAFMAIIIILGTVLVINQRAQAPANNDDEIRRLERNILDFVQQDDNLRSEVLSGNLLGVDNLVNVIVPSGFSYTLRNCTIDPPDICNPQVYIPGGVVADDTIIVANLTYFNPSEAKKLKIFMWRGGWPEGTSKPEY